MLFGVLVAMNRGRVLRGGLHDLILLTDDHQRAICLAGEAAAISHHPSHRALLPVASPIFLILETGVKFVDRHLYPRTITLDAATVEALREHRERQLLEQSRAGDAYEHGDLAFPDELHVVAARLGDRPETVLTAYAHLLPSSDAAAADAVAAAILVDKPLTDPPVAAEQPGE
jgi:hypothetical protein